MRYIKKTFAVLLTVLCLAAMLSTGALAVDSTVEYSGHDIFSLFTGTGFKTTDLFPNFKGVMPGDVLTQNIHVSNEADCCDYIKVYVRAVPGEANTDFLSRLNLTVSSGGATMFSSAEMSENVLLCTLRQGEEALLTAQLQVPAELDSAYANRTAVISWVFTVEEYEEEPGEEEPEPIITVVSDEEVPLADLARGHSHCILHWLLLLAAIITFVVYMIDRNKRRRKIDEMKKQLGE